MTERIHQPKEWALRPRARLIRTIGDQLVSSPIVAMIELIKNSYDADATIVIVRIALKPGESSSKAVKDLEEKDFIIEVSDNGYGMDKHILKDIWMEPATINKKRAKRTPGNRRVLGDKGIGRFASSRLANDLIVISRMKNTDREVSLVADWTKFEEEDTYLSDIELLFEEGKPTDFAAGGEFFEKFKSLGSTDCDHGTALRMYHAREIWDNKKIRALRLRLARLVSPYSDLSDFRIYLDVPEKLSELGGWVTPSEVFSHPHYLIKGHVDEFGRSFMSATIHDKIVFLDPVLLDRDLSDPNATDNDVPTKCGAFHIELRVWDRDNLDEFATNTGKSLRDIRTDLDSIAGVNIYRDGFRVLPYGEPNNDWLRLDLRRTQATEKIYNSQISGYVFITSEGNEQLRDQTNREGLESNDAYFELADLVKGVIGQLEPLRTQARVGSKREDPLKQGAFSRFTMSDLKDYVAETYGPKSEIYSRIEKKEQELDTEVGDLKVSTARYRRLSTLGRLIDIVLHDGRTPNAKNGNLIADLRRIIDQDPDNSIRSIQRASHNSLDKMRNNTQLIEVLFMRIEPFSGRSALPPVVIEIETLINETFDIFEQDLARAKIRYERLVPRTELKVEISEIKEVIINLLDNSRYWLARVPKDKREIQVAVSHLDDGVEIIFSDSGPGVDPAYSEVIFEPYVSTKPNGIGLGLATAGEIVSDYYNGSLELLSSGPLSGASFRIFLKERR